MTTIAYHTRPYGRFGIPFLLTICLGFSLQAGTDTLQLCFGESVQLEVDPGFATYRWSPQLGLNNPTIFNPVAVPQVTTTYLVESVPSAGQNLIENGDFSNGNSGFSSDYEYSPGANPTQGVYGVFPNANQLSPMYFEHCRDHTNQSTGLMMVVDGSPIANQKVWCQTINIEPDKTYAFSTWLTSILQPNPAALRFSINGVQIGQTFIAGIQNCQWRQFYEIWESEEATEAEICIVNQNTNPNGNDFALDDFAFFEVGTPVYDTITVLVNQVPLTLIDTSFCTGETIEYQGVQVPVSESFSLEYTSQSGCDSIVQYQAKMVDNVNVMNLVDTLCPGEILQFFNHIIDRDTLLCTTRTAGNGCDTIFCMQAVYLTETAIQPQLEEPSCFGEDNGRISLEIQAGLSPFSYLWEDGSKTRERMDLPAGNYQVTVMDAKACQASRTIPVHEPADLMAEVTTSSRICEEEIIGVIEIAAYGGTAPYQYSIDKGQNFQSIAQFSGLPPGNFDLIVEDANACAFSTAVTVPEPDQIILDVPLSSQIALGQKISAVVSDNSPSPLTYEWIPAEGVACPGCSTTELMPLRSTTYTIRATDDFGCSVEAYWHVEVSKNASLFIPNAFSPNRDGVNDDFRLYPGLGVESILEFAVFDRWGNRLVYDKNCGADCGWDGTYRGKLLGKNVYIYMVRLRYLDGETVTLSGEIVLLD